MSKLAPQCEDASFAPKAQENVSVGEAGKDEPQFARVETHRKTWRMMLAAIKGFVQGTILGFLEGH